MFSLAGDNEQISLMEQIREVNDVLRRKPHEFLELLNAHIDLSTLIPKQFRDTYYASSTNSRTYCLDSIMAILLLMQFFKFARVPDFIILLTFSPEIREFCQLPRDDIPDESVISKFKIAFEKEIGIFFDSLALKVMDIFDEHDASLPEDSPDKGLNGTGIYDTTGLKPKVKENNPKFVASAVKKQSAVKKYLDDKGENDFNPHLAAYKNLPKHASCNEAIN